ncbi:hypothetical protein ACFS2C_28045 [Prauserella oleivorans]|uniref:WXG100 family type VII secretion target n=1 Tax=Prauserella oleivorans TaxID=1478153 RepID=A0ABW5WJ99_9PSEU
MSDNDPYVTVSSGALASIAALLRGLAPVLDAIRSDIWGEHAHNNADQIRAMLAELPEVSMAYQDPDDWATSFAKYIEEGRVDWGALTQLLSNSGKPA